MSKRIIRCPECGEKENILLYSNHPNIRQCGACKFIRHYGAFEAFIPTLFDRITASPEVLAESVVYTYEMAIGGSMFRVYWTSPFIENFYLDKAEAIAATVAKLKEVENG